MSARAARSVGAQLARRTPEPARKTTLTLVPIPPGGWQRYTDRWATLDDSWMADADCAQLDSDLFFDLESGHARCEHICMGCPVVIDCLEYSLAARIEHGVWGSLQPAARARIIERRDAENRCGANTSAQARRDARSFGRAWAREHDRDHEELSL